MLQVYADCSKYKSFMTHVRYNWLFGKTLKVVCLQHTTKHFSNITYHKDEPQWLPIVIWTEAPCSASVTTSCD